MSRSEEGRRRSEKKKGERSENEVIRSEET